MASSLPTPPPVPRRVPQKTVTQKTVTPVPVQLELFQDNVPSPALPLLERSVEVGRRPWAWLLRHVFKADISTCPDCGTKMKIKEVAILAFRFRHSFVFGYFVIRVSLAARVQTDWNKFRPDRQNFTADLVSVGRCFCATTSLLLYPPSLRFPPDWKGPAALPISGEEARKERSVK